jgi:hypothetical protein
VGFEPAVGNLNGHDNGPRVGAVVAGAYPTVGRNAIQRDERYMRVEKAPWDLGWLLQH